MKKAILLFVLLVSLTNLMAQNKINLDTLDIKQLNLYLSKANNMRTTGIILAVTGGVISAITLRLLIKHIYEHGFWGDPTEPNTYTILNMCGDAAIIIGIPLLVTGNIRREKAQIALKKFDISPDNSMALGVGITLSF